MADNWGDDEHIRVGRPVDVLRFVDEEHTARERIQRARPVPVASKPYSRGLAALGVVCAMLAGAGFQAQNEWAAWCLTIAAVALTLASWGNLW
jgi:hypothetical protein